MRRPSIPIIRTIALFAGAVTGVAVPMSAAQPAFAAAATYYVDCSAAANGDGAEATPFNTLDPVNALTLGPGDSVLLKRGARCTGALTPKGSGLAGAPIAVDAYGDAALAKPGIDGAGATDTVLLSEQQYWELRNLDITNTSATAGARRGVNVRITGTGTAKGIKLTGVNVHDVSGDGTAASAGVLFEALAGGTRSNFDDVAVDGAEISAVQGSGIAMRSAWSCRDAVGCTTGDAWTGSTGVVVRGSTITGTTLEGISLNVTNKAVVEKNTVRGVTVAGQTPSGIQVANSDGATVQSNEVSGGSGTAIEIGGGSSTPLVQYNYTHENGGGAYSLGGAHPVATPTVRYNISQADGGRLLRVGGTTGGKVYNNSFHLPSGSATGIVEVTGTNTNELAVSNNIFDNLGTGGYDFGTAGTTGWTWSNNFFHGTHPAGEPADAHKFTADPLFAAAGGGANGLAGAGAYQLSNESPARGLGLPIAGNGGKDFFGTVLPAVANGCVPDIGAHQRNPDMLCLPYNSVGNPSFENDTLSPWTAGTTGTVTVGAAGKVFGDKAVKLSTAGARIEQTIAVQPNTKYTLTGFARPADWLSDAVRVGVKDFGGVEAFGDNTYPFPMQVSVTFTTGPTSTTATVYCTKSAGFGAGYCDQMSVNLATATG